MTMVLQRPEKNMLQQLTKTLKKNIVQQVGQPIYENSSVIDFFRLGVMHLLTIWVMAKKYILRRSPMFWTTKVIRGQETPILKINTFWVDGISHTCRQIREGAATWMALNVIVRFNLKKRKQTFIDFLDYFWLNIRNARAVRNRNKLVEKELLDIMFDVYSQKQPIIIASIASGSFEAVIAAVRAFILQFGQEDVYVFFFDLNKDAVEHMRKRIKEEDMEGVCIVKRAVFLGAKWQLNVVNYIRESCNFKPNIVEMAGLFDHLTEEQIVLLSSQVNNELEEGDHFITAAVNDNRERKFMEKVLEWIMFYRSPTMLQKLLLKSGFDNCDIIAEPESIHYIAICKK
ncbi:hypothetical protein COT95_00310 [Candidatus Falkowbacteria bacterium CG10_big_fil_rev_8_21_14_0_10_37_6]|uniref:Uncharacterized protein n=1 Tax=Candidatus Falkowbacteria bacterium CG10_big_fil_rev_8_21_14_0_10_37_6 TaxID=1974563 RepID=A0A2H0V7V4_9BACT|nr:MAG: hypothetical protein COT95_00310 [Candidatus Falkowbacteria bacterium CG10_big_fil_rev_8_21_14_0_10_37_6]